MSQQVYIPPEKISFRLFNKSGFVLYSRLTPNDECWVYEEFNGDFPDQWFQLVHGTGKHAGKVAIKGNASGKVLFSRNIDPRVGHIDGDGKYPDNWFTLEPGSGAYATYFRLVCPDTATKVFARSAEPRLGNVALSSAIYGDQYWTFLYEDMEIISVKFLHQKGRVLSSRPEIISTQTLPNESSIEQSTSASYDETTTETSTFSFKLGITVKVGTKFEAGLPLVAKGEVSAELGVSTEFTWGSSKSIARKLAGTFTLKAPPHKTVKAVTTVHKGDVEVPYIMTLKSKRTGATATSEGVWSGLSSWDVIHTVTEL